MKDQTEIIKEIIFVYDFPPLEPIGYFLFSSTLWFELMAPK